MPILLIRLPVFILKNLGLICRSFFYIPDIAFYQFYRFQITSPSLPSVGFVYDVFLWTEVLCFEVVRSSSVLWKAEVGTYGGSDEPSVLGLADPPGSILLQGWCSVWRA